MQREFCIQSREMTEFVEEHFGSIRAPFNAGFELTAKCNMSCVHCYATPDRKHRDFTTSEFRAIFDILVDRGLLEVYFTGGEIFMRPDFEELYVYAKSKGVSVVLLSNITLLSRKHIDLFREYPVQLISTTMYGYSQETYEQVTRAKGSYAKFMRALDLLRDSGIRYELKFVGMRQNIEDLYKVRALGKELGVEMIVSMDIHPMSDGTLAPMDYKLSAEEAFQFDVQDEGRNAFWKGVASDLAAGRIGLRPDRVCQRFGDGYLYPCSIANQFVFITSDYQMQGCVRASYRKYDLRGGTFDEGWQYLQQQLTDKKHSGGFRCASCEMIRYCEQCCANFAQESGDEEKVDTYYCSLAALRKSFVDDEVRRLQSAR